MEYFKIIVWFVYLWFISSVHSQDVCSTSSLCSAVSNSKCSAVGTGLNYECKCSPGYYALPNTIANDNSSVVNNDNGEYARICQDVNECDDPNICGTNSQCVNTAGSYECLCDNGYVGDYTISDNKRRCYNVNECAQRASLCPPQTACVDTVGSYKCVCGNGNFTNSITGACEDINECVIDGVNILNNPCDRQLPATLNFTTCINTIGSFICVCPVGYLPPRLEDLYTCRDSNECTTQNDCSLNSNCNNFIGGYNCTCKSGFKTINGTIETPTEKCLDIDECATAGCISSNCTCDNNVGSFSCRCATAGFKLQTFSNGSCSCVDIDECYEGTSDCDLDHGYCINLIGYYDCGCKAGYNRNVSTGFITCDDINECNSGGCFSSSEMNALCTNDIGCYSCKCPRGYSGNGYDFGTIYTSTNGIISGNGCTDIDECVQNPCAPSEICTNSPGSYNCLCDPQKFFVNEYNECQDRDECALGTATCPPFSTCQNTNGDYVCVCNKFYSATNSSGQLICQLDGELSEWQNIGNCSAACGGGVVRQIRNCLNGNNCNTYPEGYERTRACNTELCSTVSNLVKSCWCENVTRFLNETEVQAYSNRKNVKIVKDKQSIVDIFNKWSSYLIDNACFIAKLNNDLTSISTDITSLEKYANQTIDLRADLIKIINCNGNIGIRSHLTTAYRVVLNEKTKVFSFLNNIRLKRNDLSKKAAYCSSIGWLGTIWNSVAATFRLF